MIFFPFFNLFIFEEGVDFCRVEIFLFNTLSGDDKLIKN